MKTYNGYPNYNQWNVSLWINNDEGLYRMAMDTVRQYRNRDKASRAILSALNECGITHTPDGSRYTVTAIRGALAGM